MAYKRFALLNVSLAFAQAQQASAINCKISGIGCFNDTGTRIVSYLADLNDSAMTTESCSFLCTMNGFNIVATTAHAGEAPAGNCYCGDTAASGAQKVDDSFCNVPCPGNKTETCGGVGYSSAYVQQCDAPLPPQPHPPGPPLAAGRACSQPQAQAFGFCNMSWTLEQRVADLVNRLSIPEIGQQLTARESPAIPRLGIPAMYWGSNAIHGVLAAGCLPAPGACPTSWPDGVAMAASWNRTAWTMMGFVTGRESRAFDNTVWSTQATPAGGLTLWGPTINILRDPRWGRTQESASEDWYLAGQFGKHVSLGAQNGTDPRYMLAVVTLKHFALYSLEQYGPPSDPTEWERQTFNAVASTYDMYDTYFPAFQASIMEGGAAGVMYAANEVNGVPGCGSADLDAVLHSWGFDGYRCTDGGQIDNMVAGHKFVPTVEDAITYAIAAESDIADGKEYFTYLPQAWIQGNATTEGARKLASNIFRIRMRLGQFDPAEGQPYLHYTQTDIGAADAVQSTYIASREALVLLKNANSTLPLSQGPQWQAAGSLAVIGPHGDDTLTLQGNYGGQFCHPGPHGPVYDCLPSIYAALAASHAPGAVYSQGSSVDTSDPTLLAQALQAAQAADAVVMVLGLDQTQEREQFDRYNITLPQAQLELYFAVSGAVSGRNIPVIVVLVHGGALAIPEIAANATAILDAFYPGVTAGQPIADALFGVFSPGGKLPYTVYPPEYQEQYNFTSMAIAAARNASMNGLDWMEHSTTAWALQPEGERLAAAQQAGPPVGRTYRYYTGTPLWPFGFGLSYTTFTLAWAGPAPSPVVPLSPISPPLSLSVLLTNTGAMAGDDVVQLYYSPVPGSFGAAEPPYLPIRQLFDFQRVTVQAGGSVILPFSLTWASLPLTQADGSRTALVGQYNITVSRGYGPVLAVLVELTN